MTNKRYKLLVVDIDGTLLDKNRHITAEDTAALTRVSESGTEVSLSTGRVVDACRDILNQLGLDGYHMFFDGALVYNPTRGEEVYADPIKKESVRQLVEFTHQIGLDIDLYSTMRFFAERETWATDIRRDFFNLPATIVDFNTIWQTERVMKSTLVVASDEEKAKANEVYLRFKDRLHFSWTRTPAYPDIDFINVISPDASKGKALEALASFLGISLEEVMAIGDGVNDIPLLSAVGLAVAMENASDELKAVADYMTSGIGHNGVAEAVNRFLL
ncbi:Cof-type HAD-IIB family hydrolase [Chloroflexota bacterium]